jgi:hypothetical protein
MKYIVKFVKIKYLVCLMAGLCTMSCDYLDIVPDNVPTLAHAFSDRNTTERFLATCYYNMPYATDGNVNWIGCFDVAACPIDRENSGTRVALGLQSASSPGENYWTGYNSLFATIRDCNTFMENVDNVRELKPNEKARMKDEVKLIKAYVHFFLITYYGPIPTLRYNTSVNEATGDVRVFREKVDECFEYVLELLDEIIDSKALPDIIQNKSTEAGRFSLAAAYALKAKVLVFWASDFFNGNKEYSNFLDHDGKSFFNQDHDATRWEKAAQACRDAIEFCASKVRLYQRSDYVPVKALSSETHLINTLRNAVSERWNLELIWGNAASPGNPYFGHGVVAEYWQSLCLPLIKKNDLTSFYQGARRGVPIHIVELFYSKNGVPIDEDTTWVNNDRYKNRFKLRTGNYENRYYIAVDEQTAGLNFDREPRFYSSLGFDRGKWYGNHYDPLPEDDANCHYVQGRYGEYSSMTYDVNLYNPTGYWAKKMISLNTTYRSTSQIYYEVFPFPEMRYAELLLLAAEAVNETTASEDGQPSEETYRYIDEVRARAGLPKVKDAWTQFSNNPNKPNSKKGMRDIIRRERQIELALEGKRYYDTRRWRTAPAELNRLIEGWNIFALNAVDYYTKTTVYTQSFMHRDYLSPIPESEIIRNPQLIQNPGW